MAQPIPLEIPRRDPRADLIDRLEQAPAEHAEALLALFDIVQGLHDRGALDLARGAIGSSDELLEILVTAARSEQSIRGIRNLLLLVNMMGDLEPAALQAFTRAMPLTLQKAAVEPAQPGLWRLIKDFLWNKNFRHGLAVVNTMLETLGQSLRTTPKKDAQTHPAEPPSAAKGH